MIRTAVMSDDGLYRYSLTRQWGNAPGVAWVMLNPSTADAHVDDPTIRRCIGFSKREGFGWLVVVNLYAFRATDPRRMFERAREGWDIEGPDNYRHTMEAVEGSALVIAAWGAHVVPPGSYLRQGVSLACLGRTKLGQPRHPLYLRADAPLDSYHLLAAHDRGEQ